MSRAEPSAPPGTNPFATAPLYRAVGWQGTVPVVYKGKKLLVKTFTGRAGGWPSDEQIARRAGRSDIRENIALRLPKGVIGLDVDDYGAKHGGTSLAAMEQRWGPLPPTWTSGSRDDGISGIRFYRVPAGIELPGSAAADIEVIQFHHRYAIVWPSLHPGDERVYVWRKGGPDGPVRDDGTVPGVDELEWLSAEWVAGLGEGYVAGGGASVKRESASSDEAVRGYLTAVRDGEPCRYTDMLRERCETAAKREAGGAAHDKVRDAVLALVGAGFDGHRGVVEALSSSRRAFIEGVSDRAPRIEAVSEWRRLVAGALAIKAGEGLGIEKMQKVCVCDHPGKLGAFGEVVDDRPIEEIEAERKAAAVAQNGGGSGNGGNGTGSIGSGTDGSGNGDGPAWKLRPTRNMGDPDAYFHPDWGLRAHKVVVEILESVPAALTPEGRVALYENGVYRVDGSGFNAALARKLRNRYRPAHRKTAEEYAAALLHEQGLRLPAHASEAMLNCRNGMVDLVTGELKEHHPSYLSTTQIPVEWDPGADCPRYEWWLEDVGMSDGAMSQVEALEELVSTMLDPSRTPSKAGFLFGPSRSGKSTFLRLAQAIAGAANCSAVTLHQLSENRFMAANVYGRMLNAAADLSADDVDDISMFKMLTGEDLIQADRKYGAQFAFTNRALFLFSANELPTVSETSNAYAERIVPFRFGRSFAGREKPGIEEDMIANELPGILRRWVAAWQRRAKRGGYASVNDHVMTEFLTRSNRVAAWVAEACRVVLGWDEDDQVVLSPDPEMDEDEKRGALAVAETRVAKVVVPGSILPPDVVTSKRELSAAFNAWAQSQHGSSMGERKVVDRLTSINGICEVRSAGSKTRGLNIIYDWTKYGE